MSYYKEGPVIDPAPVLEKVIAITESDAELTPFEAKFLKETAHACTRFKDTFRFSLKQQAILNRIWADRYLASKIDRKVKKGKRCSARTVQPR